MFLRSKPLNFSLAIHLYTVWTSPEFFCIWHSSLGPLCPPPTCTLLKNQVDRSQFRWIVFLCFQPFLPAMHLNNCSQRGSKFRWNNHYKKVQLHSLRLQGKTKTNVIFCASNKCKNCKCLQSFYYKLVSRYFLMGLIHYFAIYSTVHISERCTAVVKFQENQDNVITRNFRKKSRECWECNPWPLGEKWERYLFCFAAPPPSPQYSLIGLIEQNFGALYIKCHNCIVEMSYLIREKIVSSKWSVEELSDMVLLLNKSVLALEMV